LTAIRKYNRLPKLAPVLSVTGTIAHAGGAADTDKTNFGFFDHIARIGSCQIATIARNTVATPTNQSATVPISIHRTSLSPQHGTSNSPPNKYRPVSPLCKALEHVYCELEICKNGNLLH
jgi:hypothetical protein